MQNDEIKNNQPALQQATVNCWAFNVNYNVQVKLTDLGYQKMADEHNNYIGHINNWDYRTADYYKQEAEKRNGYTVFQMWDFMKRFGGDLIGICQPKYFYLDIVFLGKDLSPCS